MPNWTTNYLACHEDDLRRIVNENGDVDFGPVMPMPEDLCLTEGRVSSYAMQAHRGENADKLTEMLAKGSFAYKDAMCKNGECKKASTLEELAELGARYAENEAKCGAANWYGWCCDNWGTKWNACDTEIEEADRWRIVRFDTAWNQPAASLIAKAFEGSKHGFIFEAFDEDYPGIFGLGYEPCKPVLLKEPPRGEDGCGYPEAARHDDLDFGQLAAKSTKEIEPQTIS